MMLKTLREVMMLFLSLKLKEIIKTLKEEMMFCLIFGAKGIMLKAVREEMM